MHQTRHGFSNEGGTLILALVVVALLAVTFDTILASAGLEQLWPVTYTQPWVILAATVATWLGSIPFVYR